jgi:hypothetical protein
MKLSSFIPEAISAWAFVEGAIPDTGTSAVAFARVSATVVRVTKANHVLTNGMWITFDGQTGTEAYLNGTWPVSNVTTNTFDFTITGAVPTTTLVVKNGFPTKIRKSYNVSKVGRVATGQYKFYFAKTMDDADFVAIGNAVHNGQAYNGPNWNNPIWLDPTAGVGMIAQSESEITIKTTNYGGNEVNVKDLHVVVIGGIN